MTRERNDFNVNFGDTIYSDSELAGAAVARTVTEKWAKYRLGLALAPLRQLRAAAGLYSGWDDHEFVNDFSRAEHGAAIYRDGVRAFLDYTPATYTARDGLYRTFRWGRNLELFFLDAPQLPEREGDRRVRRRHRPDRAARGSAGVRRARARAREAGARRRASTRSPRPSGRCSGAQLAAFREAIRASTATFKVVVNPVPLMQLYALPYDRWEGYAAERARMLADLAGVRNVVVLTTDTHAHLIGEIRTQTFAPGGPVGTGIWEVITGPVATNTYAKEIDYFLGSPGFGDGRHRRLLQAAAAARPRAPVRADGHVRLRAGDGHGDDAHGRSEERGRSAPCATRPARPARRSSSARRDGRVSGAPSLPGAPRPPARARRSSAGRCSAGSRSG